MSERQRAEFIKEAVAAGFTENQAEFLIDYFARRYHTHAEADISVGDLGL